MSILAQNETEFMETEYGKLLGWLGQGEEFLYRRLSVHPYVEGYLPVVRAVESVLSLGEDVLSQLDRGHERLYVVGTAVVRIAAELSVLSGPVPDAGGQDVENVRFRGR